MTIHVQCLCMFPIVFDGLPKHLKVTNLNVIPNQDRVMEVVTVTAGEHSIYTVNSIFD